jgi:hypothetical protein
MKMTNSTLSGNSAATDGGIFNYYYGSTLTVTNSTLSGNSAGNGGGIFNGGAYMFGNYYSGTLTVQNSTLSGNSVITDGGGIYNYGTLNYYNTLIANSTSGEDCINGSDGIIRDNVNNLVEDGTCSDSGVNFLTGDPLLGPLADNGGATWTHALLPGSPAIDAVPVISCTVTTDQRGVVRPQGAACDIGAYEAIIIYFPLVLRNWP